MPPCRFRDPGDPNLALDETQDGIPIGGLVNNAWNAQTVPSARVHQLIMDAGIDPAMEPDERHVPKIPQTNAFSLRQWMPCRYGEDHSVQRKLPMLQFLVPRRDGCSEPNVQSAGQDGLNLMNRHQVMQHKLDVWVPAPELAKGVHHHPMPGNRRGNADLKCTGLAQRNPFGATLRLVDVLQDTALPAPAPPVWVYRAHRIWIFTSTTTLRIV